MSKIDKIKAFIAPKMTDLITFLTNNRKSSIYTGENINGTYHYIEMIGYPATLTISGQRSHHLGTSSSTNNDAETLQPVISYLLIIQKTICKYCGSIGHKADACIIHLPSFIPPSLRINIK